MRFANLPPLSYAVHKMAGKKSDLNERILKLEREKNHLENKLRLLGAGASRSLFTIPDAVVPLPKSITGLESMYVEIGIDYVVSNCNTKFADLISKAKEEILGKPIALIDLLPWARGIFATLVEDAKNAGNQVDFETSYIDTVSGCRRHLLFHASFKNNLYTIIIDETTQYHQILNTFQRYVSPAVVEKMQGSTQDFFKTERAVLTVLFADLRGFTGMASGLKPEEVRDLLNECHTSMIHTIDQYEGTVDKLIGDEVMAIFGAPIHQGDHALRAIRVAMGMQLSHQKLLRCWKAAGKPAPPLGIGINTGEMVVGNIGCDTRMDYTVIGHHVNLASRLCDVAEGGEIIVSQFTTDALSDYARSHPEDLRRKIQFKKSGTIRAKGLKDPIAVSKVLFAKDEESDGI